MKNTGGFEIEEEGNENLLCICFSEEQLAEVKKYADISGMEVEEFIKSVCLAHCLQQMECLYGEEPETPEVTGGAAKSENGIKIEPRKVEFKGQKPGPTSKEPPASKDLLEGPLVLDPQCIMDLFAIKRELGLGDISNNKIITIALKLGLNQLSVALGLLKDKLKD